MIRKQLSLLTLALGIAAVAIMVPIAHAASSARVDPLAVGYLTSKGLSAREVTSWTVGACSHVSKASACYAMLEAGHVAAPVVDPLAVGYLTALGLSPSEVASWTVGACSHRAKAASCYAMLRQAPRATVVAQAPRSIGFQWGDAGIGAGFTLGIVLVLAAAAGLVLSRTGRGRRAAHV